MEKMKAALTEEEFKAILRHAYEAGEKAKKQNDEIDRLIEEGTKSCPARPSFENYYFIMITKESI